MATESRSNLTRLSGSGHPGGLSSAIIDQNPLIYAERDRFLAGLPSTLHEANTTLFTASATHPTRLFLICCEQLFQQHHDAQQHTVYISS